MSRHETVAIATFAMLALLASVGASQRGANCDDRGFILDVADYSCQACPPNSHLVSGMCVGNSGYACHVDANSGAQVCEDCAAKGMMTSALGSHNASESCVACGGDRQLSCLNDATYNATTQICTCPAGSVLVQQVGTLILSAVMCAPCTSAACIACSFPYTLVEGSSVCQCGDGFTMLYDGSCVPTVEYTQMAAATAGTSTVLNPPNIDNEGSAGPPISLPVAQVYSVGAAILCERGNTTACNLLANLCVLMHYRPTTTPCALFLELKRSRQCLDPHCETVEGLPWLYYTRSNAEVLSGANAASNVDTRQQLRFVVSVYDLYGNWLGYEAIVYQVNPCFLANTALELFFVAGDTRVTSCNVNWVWFTQANASLFYELYLEDPSNATQLLPVPILMDYSNYRFHPHTFDDAWLYRGGASADGQVASAGFRRRFFAYDNAGGRDSSQHSSSPRYITTLWNAAVVLGARIYAGSQATVPLLVLQYASKMTSTIADAVTEDPLKFVLQNPLNDSGRADVTLSAEMHAFYLPDSDPVSGGMKIALIVTCILCFVSAWVCVYGWMRRRQYLVFDWLAALRFLVYLCSHISNCFFIVVSLASWYLLVAYKNQSVLSRAMRTDDAYLNGMLYAAVTAKGVAVFYGLIEQCNADFFVIDWERSKGQLLRENKIVPVSMWRSTFLANELNELQALRYWHPLPTIAIVLLFLVGAGYQNLSASVPRGSRHVGDMTTSFDTLRIAVDTFFWVAVGLVVYVLEYQIYYRFVVVHPLQAFVDLCSVSNISIMILLEQQWGFYIHGESIHAHADVSMQEFQRNLFLEAQGNLPVRGLGGQNKCQSFEVYLGPYTRQYLYMCYMEMYQEHLRSLGKRSHAVSAVRWHYFSFLFGMSRKPRVYSQTALAIRDRMNYAFQQSVRRAESSLLAKLVLQKWLNFPPNVMYMNGPQHGDQGGKDLFFMDNVRSYGSAFLCGLDLDLFILYAALFAAIDASLHNVYAAAVLTFAVEMVIRFYRVHEGLANLSQKAMMDERFFL